MTGRRSLGLERAAEGTVFVSAPPTPFRRNEAACLETRVTMMRWSCESMQVPPGSPVTQLSGSGLAQKGSTLKVGATAVFRLLLGGDRLHADKANAKGQARRRFPNRRIACSP